MTKQLVQIVNKVNNAAIRRVNVPGKGLFYVVPSYTLPDDCVMNDGFYPADEIAASFQTLEGTPAPIEHPYNESGEYIPANSPDGILFFQCGVFNKNVQRVADDKYGHRVYVEKWIHVETAMQSERGKRLIDTIDRGEPIHSSTGIMLESVPEIGVNAQGKKYSWRATNMHFDHDAILFDEEGAATPEDGVGLLVNKHLLTTVNRDGRSFAVNSVQANTEQPSAQSMLEMLSEKIDNLFARIANHGGTGATVAACNKTNQEGENMGLKTLMQERLGDAYNEDMTEEEMLNAYEKRLEENAAEAAKNAEGEQPKGEQVANANIQKLVADAVAAQFAANAKAQEAQSRKDLAEKLKTNGVELSESDQESMSVNALQAFVERTSPAKTAYGLPAGQVSVNNSESRFSADLPE